MVTALGGTPQNEQPQEVHPLKEGMLKEGCRVVIRSPNLVPQQTLQPYEWLNKPGGDISLCKECTKLTVSPLPSFGKPRSHREKFDHSPSDCRGSRPPSPKGPVEFAKNMEIFPRNLTHMTRVSRTPKKPEHLIARSQLNGVRWDSVPFNFWWRYFLVGGFNPLEKY